MASSAQWRTSSEAVDDLHMRLWDEQNRVRRRDEEIEYLNSKVSKYMTEARSSRQEIETLQAELDEHRAANGKLQRDLEAQSQLLHIRGVELREAQAYVATIDTVSHTEILGVVDALNAEIFQFAAQAVDGIEFVRSASPGEISPELEGPLGAGMIEVLEAVAQGRCDTIGVQIALQAVLVWFASWTVSAWAADTKQDAALKGIFERIFITEPQGIAAKWKALTKQHSVHLCLRGEDLQIRLLRIAACTLRSAGGYLGGMDDGLLIKMGEIIKLTIQLRSYIGEDATSSEFTVIHPVPGAVFTKDVMDDTNAVRGKDSTGVVLCTTELGLMRCEQMRKSRDDVGSISTTVLKKAIVVLEDTIGELMHR